LKVVQQLQQEHYCLEILLDVPLLELRHRAYIIDSKRSTSIT
jgi:hypothetical protein